jgi:hypothetical protein
VGEARRQLEPFAAVSSSTLLVRQGFPSHHPLVSSAPNPLLRLHRDDNVLTVISPLAPGAQVTIEGVEIKVTVVLPIGHKVAARAIAAGEKIIKYGVPIGSATHEVAAGEHVHTHNVKSDYLPTYLREDQAQLFGAKTI